MSDLDAIVAEAIAQFSATSDLAALEQTKARYLGKAGSLTEQLKGLGKLPPEARKAAGGRINQAKDRIEAALVARRQALAQAALNARLAEGPLDATFARPRRRAGRSH